MRLFNIYDERGVYLRSIAAKDLDDAWRRAEADGITWRGVIDIRPARR